MIRKIALGFATFAIAFSFAGCSDKSNTPDSVVTVTAAPEASGDTGLMSDADFVAMLKHDTNAFDNDNATDIVALAESTCGAFNRGGSFEEVAGVLLSNGVSPYESGYFIGGTVATYCPEFMDLLPNGSSSGA